MSLNNYNFKGVPKPFAHQVETTQFIVDTPKCFVFNDIGTGKTWSGAWAIDYLASIGEVKHVLIVAPLSTLEIVWKRTFFHLNSILSVEILKGTAAKRKAVLHRAKGISPYKVSIINPDAIHIIADEITDVDMVLVDESAMFRNAKSRRVKALNTVCKDKKRIVMMTGSPCPEAPTDIWASAKIVCPERVSKWFGQFRDLVMRKINTFKWVALPDAQETIALLLKGFHIRFRRDECIDLPPSHHAEIEVDATKQQKDLIRHIRKEAVAMVEDGAINAANEAVVISKILQIASGAVRFTREDGTADIIETDCQAKFDALDGILEASTQPVILFAPFTAVIGRITDHLTRKSVPHCTVTGATSTSERLRSFDALQSGMVRVLVAHPQAMAHGITLTNSNVVVWWCPIYSHEIYEQANGRVVRPGQTRDTYFVHLTCSALESRVLRKLESKSVLQGTLLDYLQREES
jgi:SNF2 family DNA or RNA helicase